MGLKEYIKKDYGRFALVFLLIFIGGFTLTKFVFSIDNFILLLPSYAFYMVLIFGTISLLFQIIFIISFVLSIISFIKQGFNWKAFITFLILILLILVYVFLSVVHF